MIPVGPTVERLKSAGFAHVEGVLEFAALTAPPRLSPALFVVPERETAQPNRLGSGGHDQKISETFAVVLVVRTERNADAVSEALQEHSSQIEQALIGWSHPGASGPCEYTGARLMSAEPHHVAWAMSFSVSRHFRKVSQ